MSTKALPIQLRIFLVPQKNILTIDCCSGSFGTDEVLGNLVDFEDEGKQIRTQELELMQLDSSERAYLWLHSLAGLSLAFSSQSQSTLQEMPHFVTGENEVERMLAASGKPLVTTNHIFGRIWQRLASRSILALQIKHLESGKFLDEVTQQFTKVKEFEIVKSTFTLGNLRKTEVEDSADHYAVDVKSEHGWHFKANIVVPVAYPRHPPIFTLTCLKTSPKQ